MFTDAFIDQWQRDRAAGLRRRARRRARQEPRPEPAPAAAVRTAGPRADVRLTSDEVIRLDREAVGSRR